MKMTLAVESAATSLGFGESVGHRHRARDSSRQPASRRRCAPRQRTRWWSRPGGASRPPPRSRRGWTRQPPQAATIMARMASPVIGQKRRRRPDPPGRMADPRTESPHAPAGNRSRARRGLAGLARRTQAEQLEPVVVDAIARPPGDVLDDRAKARVGDRIAPTAARADDVVVVGRLAADVGVLAGGQVEPLDRTELLQHLERAEDGRPADAEMLAARRFDQLGGGEVAVAVRDEGCDGAPRSGQAVAGVVERRDDRRWVSHGATSLPQVRHSLNKQREAGPLGPRSRDPRPSHPPVAGGDADHGPWEL